MNGVGIGHWGPMENWTVPQVLGRQARRHGDRQFLQIEDGPALSFSQVLEASQLMGRRLAALGVGAGDLVLVMAPTCVEVVEAWFGATLIGAADVTLNVAYRGNSLVHAVNLSAARVMLVDAQFLARLADVENELVTLETVVTIGPVDREPSIGRLRVVALADVNPVAALDTSSQTDYRDIASVVYTSGTTGPAKGVLITHAQAYTSAHETLDGFRMVADDVFYCFHPLFHIGAKFQAVYAALIAGCKVVLDRVFDPTVWVDRLRAYGATLTIGHGPMLEMIYAQPPRPDDADNPLRVFMAAPFPRYIAEAFEERFGAVGVEVYGMTEITVPVWRPLDEPLRLGSCGKLRQDLFELRIVDPETDLEVPTGEIGEITIRPKLPWTIMQGYLSMERETLQAWRNLWFHTGDAAYWDADGYLYFVDRAKDRIRRRAENISSYEIEVAAGRYPGVRECAAVGVASDYEADDDIKLYVAMDETLDCVKLTEHLVRTLPHYMVPRYVEVIDELPRTPTNKVRKQQLREAGVSEATWDRKASGISIRDLSEAAKRSD